MFVHGKTGKKYYSVREKINYYKKVIACKVPDASAATKRKAKLRLKTLQRLNNRDYSEPCLVATDDKHFGNSTSKPRGCVVVDCDQFGRLLVSPLRKRVTKLIVLDKDPDRQVGDVKRWIDSSEVYEIKSISNMKSLNRYDKEKVKSILRKK